MSVVIYALKGCVCLNTVSPDDMTVDDRRKKILELLEKDGKVKVVELSRLFKISEVTIRNDFSELENSGMLDRVHGGAISTNKAYFNMNFYERIGKFEKEKRKIASAAAKMINTNDTVMINSGTTTFFIAQELKNLKALTIVTNSISIVQELAAIPNFNVILLGGNYNAQYQFTYGEDALQQLRKYKTDKLILSADGVSSEYGLTTHHHQEADISRGMIERVNQLIVVADFSKIGRENFANIAPIEAVDYLITNTTANTDELANLTKKGIEITAV
jgi:DeoR/GlpR family transcriptional regulator of sugar metabolism